jgi:hypothetical protein
LNNNQLQYAVGVIGRALTNLQANKSGRRYRQSLKREFVIQEQHQQKTEITKQGIDSESFATTEFIILSLIDIINAA